MYENDMIIIFFGELSTKGKNIMNFIRLLGKNIKTKLTSFSKLTYDILKDHIYIHLNGEDFLQISKLLKQVPGIFSFALAKSCSLNMDEICKLCLLQLPDINDYTFKIETKRPNKNFKYNSMEISAMIGEYILRNCKNCKVNVINPDVTINVMIRYECAYVYQKKEKGLGGYPLGIAGKALHLISGGIDSPLAAYYMMKRGIKLEMIHFAAPPYTNSAVLDKITDLLHVLNNYQDEIKLYIIPFTTLEKRIYEVAGPSYCVTIMRRMMLRISKIIATKNNDILLSTGESLGQVASQTLPSIKVIEECINMPVIRPLACFDKSEIIEKSTEIGTYNISIRPFEDCCTIFPLKDPVTHPNLEIVKKIEDSFDYQPMIIDCVNNAEIKYVNNKEIITF